jgi:hypothetical protein
MTVLDTSLSPVVARPQSIAPSLPLEMPKLLEYRGDADPDGEFILKTICGFAGGTLLMFFFLDFAEALIDYRFKLTADPLQAFMVRMAFMVGITGVACSLLLVGLKVRADHCAVQLYARHWLNSITTGGVYAFLIWIPWMVMQHMQGVVLINRFVAAAIWMVLMSIPVLAAKWTIAPHPDHTVPAAAPGVELSAA